MGKVEKKYMIFCYGKSIIKLFCEKLGKNLFQRREDDSLLHMLEQYEEKICNKEIYEKQWKCLRQQYQEIEIYIIEWVSLGETLNRLYQLMCDLQEEASGGKLKVVLPFFFSDYCAKSIFNYRVFDVFEKYLYIINNKNMEFWKYVFTYHRTDIKTSRLNRYCVGRCHSILVDSAMPFIGFSEEQIAEAHKKMKKMGIDGEYICIHARDGGVKKAAFSAERAWQTEARECDINSFQKAVLYFQEKGLQSVRLGKYERQRCTIPGIVDYANKYHDDLMDFYLVANCRFLIGCDSGLTDISTYWRVPHLLTNMVRISNGYEGVFYIKESMYIPKKIWSQEKQRYLNLVERFRIESKYDISERNLKGLNLGIQIEDNTEEEIYQAAMELYDRLNGTWVESEEEKEAFSIYWKILDRWKTQHSEIAVRRRIGERGYAMCPLRLSWNYLKNNMYLLENDINV